MRALVYERFGGPITVAELPTPVVPAGGAVVQVAASGLCRSDWHAWAGHDDSVQLPQVPGHEFAGVVAEVGAAAARWRPGDRVTAPFVNGCGACPWCADGQAQVCPQQTQPGFTHPGSHAEFVVVRAADTNLVALPPDLSFDAAASLGCRFATAYRALTARGRVQAGEWVAVFGAGGVGLSAVLIATALGARTVVVDPSDAARRRAADLGAAAVVAAGPDAVAEVVDVTGGGAHVAVDAVGAASTSAAGVLSLRRLGRFVQVGLLRPPLPAIPLDLVLAWELEVLGSHGMPASDYPAMLDLVTRGVLRPQDLVSRTVGCAEAASIIVSGESPDGVVVLHPARD